MGLGLVVRVAALGAITARAVVERRQQIGVLRAIGFQRHMVQLSFLLESSFIALSSIIIGRALGLAVAYSFIHDAQQLPLLEQHDLQPAVARPRDHLPRVYLIALATTYAPSIRASLVYAAERFATSEESG